MRIIGMAVAGILVATAIVFGIVKFGDDSRAETRKPHAAAAFAEDVPPDTVPSEAPTIEPYARRLEGKTETGGPVPKTVKPVEENFDGCDHGYGAVTQCVPWTFPAGVKTEKQKCAWLTAQGFKTLQVHGTDRHKLDPDKNGVACD